MCDGKYSFFSNKTPNLVTVSWKLGGKKFLKKSTVFVDSLPVLYMPGILLPLLLLSTILTVSKQDLQFYEVIGLCTLTFLIRFHADWPVISYYFKNLQRKPYISIIVLLIILLQHTLAIIFDSFLKQGSNCTLLTIFFRIRSEAIFLIIFLKGVILAYPQSWRE